MRKFTLVTWAVFIMTFLTNLQFSDAKQGEIQLYIENLTSLSASCCSKKQYTLSKLNGAFHHKCAKFFMYNCFIELITGKVGTAREVKIRYDNYTYTLNYVKDISNLGLMHTNPRKQGVPWTLVVNTANTSAEAVGRIYLILNSYHKSVDKNVVALANSFDNFKPGAADNFTFISPNLTENFCVSIRDSIYERWIMASMILTQVSTNETYTFYHGERTTHHYYCFYKGRNSVNWTIEVTTGIEGMNCTFEIILRHDENGICKTKLTLDTENDDFRPNTTDVFHVQAKKCTNALQSISARTFCSYWILEKVNATDKDGNSYVFYHNETLPGWQTFYVNQSSGDNSWVVSVCSENATDREVYLKIHGCSVETGMIRLTTAANDFQANQCSNFTLYLKDIGNLSMIEVKKPKTFTIKTITLYNDGKVYKFETPKTPSGHLQIVYHKIVQIPKNYTVEQNRTVWSVNPLKSRNIEMIEFVDSDDRRIFVRLEKARPIPIMFSTWSKPFKVLNLVKITPTYACNIQELVVIQKSISKTKKFSVKFEGECQVELIETSSTRPSTVTYLTSRSSRKSTPRSSRKSTPRSSAKSTPRSSRKSTPRSSRKSTPRSSAKSTPRSSRKSTPRSSTKSTPRSSAKSKPRSSTKSTPRSSRKSTPRSSTKSTLRSSTKSTPRSPTKSTPESQTNSAPFSRTKSTPESPPRNSTEEKTRKCLKCIKKCSRNISKEETAERLNKIEKELKVNRKETSRYLRSKTSAPDERVSSRVIGSTAVIIMAVPFGLIVLVDLIPLFNFIFKR